MAALNVMCSICMEFYKPDSVVYSTVDCGHLFHRTCIERWLNNANTCPRCCKPCNNIRIHRVYLDFNERTEADAELDLMYHNYPIWSPLEGLDMRQPNDILKKAIKTGKTEEGHDTYVARVYYKNDLLPASYVPERNGVFTSYGCHSHFLTDSIELLLDCDTKWVEDYSGHVPDGAICAGYTELGEPLYTGRGLFENHLILGKVHPSHRVLYMPFQTKEVNTNSYEVLVQLKNQQKSQSQTNLNTEEMPPVGNLYPRIVED